MAQHAEEEAKTQAAKTTLAEVLQSDTLSLCDPYKYMYMLQAATLSCSGKLLLSKGEHSHTNGQGLHDAFLPLKPSSFSAALLTVRNQTCEP